jgi:hypothetical protein
MALNNPLQNAAAGQSIFGGINPGQAYNAAHTVSQHPSAERRIESMFDHNRQMHVSVINADNGFILTTRTDLGSHGRVLVAATIEELRDLITSEMVSRKMGK